MSDQIYNVYKSRHYVDFYGTMISTTVTNDPEAVEEWISQTERLYPDELTVGLDVEWKPSYSLIQNPPAVLQLCVAGRCLIYQILWSPFVPPAMHDFLSNPKNTFVGVGVKEDLNKLANNHQGLGGTAKYVELAKFAEHVYKSRRFLNIGLKNLANHVVKKDMDKPRHITMSNWAVARLTKEQIIYACVDAFVSYDIGKALKDVYPSSWSSFARN